MDLSLSSEQEDLRDVLTSLLDKHASPERVRAAEPLGFDDALWDQVVEFGLPGIGVAEASGGTGAGLLDLGLVAEACGRYLAPVPFVEAPVAARAVAASSGPVERVLDGSVVSFSPRPAKEGTARAVPFGAVAERMLGLDAGRLVLVEYETAFDPLPSLGCSALAHVPLCDGPGVVAVEELASGEEAHARYERALDEWCILTGAALAGLAARALELGVSYVQERHQFGVPIGSFQSVAHRLADVAAEVDGASLLWQEAAWALDEGEADASALARMAFVFAGEVAERASLTSLHFHGGYGFMLEYDIQLLARRAKAWPLAFGSRAGAVARLGDALYGPKEA